MKHLLAVAVLLSSSAFAECYKYNQEITLEGVLTTKATYIDPNDFGWAPKNGFQAYDALVLSEPICFEDKELETDEHMQTAYDVYVVQTSASKISSDAKRDGVKVKITGSLITQHTGHHFQKLILIPTSITTGI